MEVACYLPPTLPPLRWLGNVGADLPPAVQQRLRSMLFGAVAPLILGSMISIATTLIVYHRSGDTVFAAIAALDALVLPVRIQAWRQERRPTDLVFAAGLLWATLIATTVFLVILFRDLPMSLLVMAWSFASISGIVGRNFLAPRYAVVQVGTIMLGMVGSIAIVEPPFLIFAALLSLLFIVVTRGLIKRQREMTIQVVTSDMESRAQSFVDPLTGLLNRRGLEAAFATMAAPSAAGIGLLYLDLDGFKQVNDRLGHGAGDRVLTEVGRRLTAAAWPDAAICRLGGDEFLVLVPRIEARDLHALGAEVIASVAAPYQIEPTVLARIGASIGAVVGGPDAADLPRMMILADQALYAAKASGKGRCILYTAGAAEPHGEPVRCGAEG
ncbi:hypothetical protein ASF53_16080 [Methylobacterium sp. Leaf123]|uniref:GGDEF domain-containing protein n=1 Tax=Methylobacterium sp. Leaf123 TaxID=1736264 RepID=UPI0006FEC429|nr:GGDEF domain-containing protein [Methylobacterium sp. Leaf123]KQQ12171.1 hypothetical protein ASF53_16080 [Methylobacterium sp. Leaf123]